MSRTDWAVIVVGLWAATSCVVPTDRGANLGIDVETDEVQLFLGERTTLVPTAVNAAGAAVTSITFAFASSDPAVARVDTSGTVLAAGVGTATIVVTARAFESATPDSVTVRVIDNVRFDNVAPDTVRFGDTITVVGVALDPADLALVAIGGVPAPVAAFGSMQPAVSGSRDTLRIVVPVGAAPASDVVVLHERGASASAPVTVLQYDRFEPNDSGPAWIPDPLTFSSAQLALESGGRPVDWYRFGPIDQSVTIEVRLGIVQQFGVASVTLNSPVAARGDTPSWSMRALTLPWNSQQASYDQARGPTTMCHGLFAVYRHVRVSPNRDFSNEVVRFPLLDTALDSVDLIVELLGNTDVPWAYGVRVVPGYISDFPPDAYEENDFCDVAPTIGAGVHTLTLDNLFDVDWLRLRVSDVAHDLSVSAEYQGGSTSIVDIDLVLYQDTTQGIASWPDLLPLVGFGTDGAPSFGPNTVLSQALFDCVGRQPVHLQPGDYLLLVRNANAFAANRVVLTVAFTPNPGGTTQPVCF